MTINTVLIANRGEIACRIIRSARARGYRTIAIFTEPDRTAPHVEMSDHAIYLGDIDGAPEPYLDIERIISAALENGVEAIHPGYGFLSENAEFSKRCEDADLIFVGPSPDAISQMGDKALAKRIMRDAGVPCVPGYDGKDQSEQKLRAEAKELGTPLLVKAVAGGGGRGMRRVDDLNEFDEALGSARSEALSAFGSGDVILERALDQVRHIEIQIAADSLGNVVHLFERDCSAQRRNQKVVEEAPSPVVDEKLRAEMGEIACQAATAINYTGVGTLEFLMTPDREFYFIEMNTRLQVEHPVTEMITGFDLVDWQFQIAEGGALPCSQNQISLKGAAMEVRLYAEDPGSNFMPQTGEIAHMMLPEMDGLRFDLGVAEGNSVGSRYDPMLAKIIAYGNSREAARQKLAWALRQLELSGLKTNRSFLVNLIEHPLFTAGEIDTQFIAQQLTEPETPAPVAYKMIALGADYWLRCRQWSNTPDDWSSLGSPFRRISAMIDGENIRCGMRVASNRVAIQKGDICDEEMALTFEVKDNYIAAATYANVTIHFDYWWDGDELIFDFRDRLLSLTPLIVSHSGPKQAQAEGTVFAPMDGKIVASEISVGDDVAADTMLLVLEAMKMEHRIRAPIAGSVTELKVNIGDQVARGDTLVVIDSAVGEET